MGNGDVTISSWFGKSSTASIAYFITATRTSANDQWLIYDDGEEVRVINIEESA